MLLGDLYERKGEFTAAAEQFRKGIELRPGSVHYHLRLAQLYSRTRRHEKALEVCTRATALFPHAPVAYYALGNAQCAVKDLENALRSYEKACHLEPGNPRYEAAIEDLKGKLKERSTSPAGP